MAGQSQAIYLICTRRKGRQKKHIDICRRCRWNKSCAPFQQFCQTELPFTKKQVSTAVPLALSHDQWLALMSSLKGIRALVREPNPDREKDRGLASNRPTDKSTNWIGLSELDRHQKVFVSQALFLRLKRDLRAILALL